MFIKSIKKGKNSSFYRFLVSYIIVLLIPMIIGSLIYLRIVQTVKKETFEKNREILDQTSKTVESSLKQIKKSVEILSMSPYLDNITTYNTNSTYYDRWKVVDQLKMYRVINENVVDYIIYPQNCDFILTSNNQYDNDSSYENDFQYSNINGRQWYKYITTSNFSNKFLCCDTVNFNGKCYKAIPYIHSSPMLTPGSSNGTIVALIDSMYIKNMLNDIDIGEKGYIKITDADNKTILIINGNKSNKTKQTLQYLNETDSEDKNENKNDMIISSVTSGYNKWIYTSYIPKHYALSNINYTKILIYSFMISSLLCGVLTALWFAYFNNKPLKEIVQSLTRSYKRDKYTNDYEFVKKLFKQITSDNKQLKKRIDKQLPIIKISFIDRLLKGKYSSESEIEAVLSQIDFDFNCKWYQVIILKVSRFEDKKLDINTISQLNIIRAIVNNVISEESNDAIFSHYLDEDKIAILNCYNENDTEECKACVEEFVQKILEIIYKEYNMEIIVGAGNFYSKITRINQSFEEASYALEGFNIGRKIVWFTDISQNGRMYYYPVNIEAKLINTVKLGNKEAVNKILKNIYYENFYKRKLTPEISWLLIDDLVGTFIKTIANMETPQKIDELLKCIKRKDSLDYTYEKIINMFETICERINSKKAVKQNQLIKNVIEYINDNYTDASLSLYKISRLYKIGESHLSLLFKQEIGKTFSSYIEDKRINSACKIINGDINISINKIALEVGYSNDTTFRRAFKRVTGLNPREYKNNREVSYPV